ncbi:hypothetical protein BN946_scf184858.g33 [Trametes cinnabarina]|uniref:PUB domain-containing protein n=1 Tax=Pycnoporus cinnabarinus TaxID=5643 RepID=A0A060SSZ1_PYCCI|nr:hypothetical protein BN946_scf184858.g33 [Trametes cinnabarina]
MAAIDRAEIAAAAARRVQALRTNDPARVLYTVHDSEWEARQQFRKMIDRGILATSSLKSAVQSLEAVLRLAKNILTQPDVPKFRKFNVRNEHARRLIVEPKGVLELVVELGFREIQLTSGCQTEDLETYYVFSGRRMNELRIGAAIIEEIFERRMCEEEEARQAKQEEEKKAHLLKQRQLFLDDRRNQIARGRERVQTDVPPSLPRRRPAPKGAKIMTLQSVVTTHLKAV